MSALSVSSCPVDQFNGRVIQPLFLVIQLFSFQFQLTLLYTGIRTKSSYLQCLKVTISILLCVKYIG